eukprot:TRINITY_DN262_c0_g1_i1.p1 TRINITY_DN262_c0_g1~~TRINITY_DN262_c0_g1_i1.p1  ORF type:complete len:760 (+),score=356.52 TRINITY_DN262_c0_g1_i1:98-2281(+)
MVRIASLLLVSCLATLAYGLSPQYLVGSGIGDITGPAAEANFMGMANVAQMAHGIQLRLWARAFVFADPTDTNRFAFVSADIAFVPGAITEGVIQNLQQRLGNRYSFANVMISATHTHSGPGGYSTETLYDVTSFGFIKENFDTIINGITAAIVLADSSLQPGNIKINNGTLLNTNANRSPYSYTYNPEANQYPYNVDKNMTVLRIEDNSGNPIGMIDWFAVHGTSMNNTNTLISGDNKGFASWYVERYMNGNKLPGKGKFVAAFAQCNEGDVSPNTLGAMCPDGSPCDPIHSTCNGRVEGCIAPGPGKDMTESCQIIGTNQAEKAMDLFNSASTFLQGPVAFRHTYLDFETITVSPQFSSTGATASTCTAALGDSFAAGTTDGPGSFNFVQGTNSSATNPKWNDLGGILSKPTEADIQCQYPKPILLNIGDITFPEHAPWSASVIPLQLFRVGQLFIIGVPGEFTTMSGRRLINQVRNTLVQYGAANENSYFVIAGLSNEYIHYITTPQEFNIQRYEAASTIYGPQELPAFLQEFTTIAKALAQNTTLPPGPPPPTYNFTLALFPTWKEDTHPIGKNFGSVLSNVQPTYKAGDLISVQFQGANPRNNYMTNSTFLAVERLVSGSWSTILTDADWETIFHWDRHLLEEHQSVITIKWQSSTSTPAGTYRIQYFGVSKASSGTLTPFTATSSSFNVTSSFTHSLSGAPDRVLALEGIRAWWKNLNIEI